MNEHGDRAAVAELIDLIVHDLRNPVATVGANLSFVHDAIRADGDPELREAFDDMTVALSELMQGLEQLSTIGRVLGGRRAAEPSMCDLERCVSVALVNLGLPVERVCEGTGEVLGGPPLARLVTLLVRNAALHGRGTPIVVRTAIAAGLALLEVCDGGPAIAADLRVVAFDLAGQHRLKARVDGRYSKNAGLPAAAALAGAIGGTLCAGGEDGAAVFRLELPLTSPPSAS